MPSLQIRPKDDPNAPAYAPERDIAHAFPQIIIAAVSGLDEENWTAEMRELLKTHCIPEAVLTETLRRVMESHRNFIRNRDVKSADDALQLFGFYEMPLVARLFLTARIGQVCMAAYFNGLRDVTMQGDMPPTSFIQMLADGRAIVQRMGGGADAAYAPGADMSQTELAEATRTIEQLQQLLTAAENQVAAVNTDNRVDAAKLQRVREAAKAVKRKFWAFRPFAAWALVRELCGE